MNGANIYTTVTTSYNVRDQILEYRQFAGSSGASSLATTNEYDGYGRLWWSKQPIEGSSSTGIVYQYNANDSIQTVTDPRGVITSFAYNNRGLLQNINFNPNGAPNVASYGPISFTYDSVGNRLSMTDSSGSSEYHYDTLSRMDWEKRHFNGLAQDYFLYYQYNLVGQVREIKDHFNDATYYNYDKVGRVVSVTGADLTRGEQYQYTSSNPASLIKYRAWDGIREFKYGNNIQTSLSYDSRLRNSIFEITGKAQGPDDPDPSPQAMKTEAEYDPAGQLRYVRDHKDATFNRAFKWDHLGRMEEAYSGFEADVFANKPQSGLLGPFRQSFQYDQFGHLTQRATRFWSKNDTVNVSYDTTNGRNQNPAWQYDAAGKLTQDENLKYFYNAAGLNWQIQDLNGVPKNTQEYDGSGNVVKDDRSFHFYLNSTVLGGVPVAELLNTGEKDLGNIYLGGTRIAQLKDGTGGAWNPPDKWVIWNHVNPTTGSNGRSSEQAWYYKESELDAMGVNVGFEDPFILPNPPDDPNTEPGIPGLLSGAGETGRKCTLDGITVDCAFVMPLIESGAAVRAPSSNVVSVFNNRTSQFVGFAFWDGRETPDGHFEFGYKYTAYDESTNSMLQGIGTISVGTYSVDIMQGEFFGLGGGLGLQQSKKSKTASPTPKKEERTTDDAGRTCDRSERQYVYVKNRHTRLTGSLIGHTWIQVPSGSWGFGPNSIGLEGAGSVQNNSNPIKYSSAYTITYTACPETMALIEKTISEWKAKTDLYYVYNNRPKTIVEKHYAIFPTVVISFAGYNCTGWVCMVLESGGIKPPVSSSTPGIYPFNAPRK
jgi:YD repeat-containing protein